MTKYMVCFTTYGQTFVEADTQEEAEEIAMQRLQEKGTPEFTQLYNDWEMVDETEEIDDFDWNQRKLPTIQELRRK